MRTVLLILLAVLACGPIRAQPVITLDAATDRELYHANSHNKIYVEAQVHVADPAARAAAATVRNIAFVLDRSGSMAGAPIQALRRAMSAALNSLSDHDVVSVVVFGSEVETLVDAKRRDHLGEIDAVLAKLEPAGGAALYDALNQGAAQLRRYAGPSTINHLILVTDGRPTKGPREFDDFSRLAEVFAREGFTLSTIGIGQDFNEDLLATLARSGNGHFRYVDQPDKLTDALQAEIAPLRTLVARDAILTIEFRSSCEDVESYGWKQANVENQTVTYHFPYLFADQDLSVLVSAKQRPIRIAAALATVRLSWNDLAEGKSHSEEKALSVVFEADERAVRTSLNPGVIRVSVGALISEGMQEAIEQLDKGDFRRALRALRNARDDAQSLNDDLEDPQIAAKIAQLEAYLAEVQARGLNQLDRKILRSGLFNQFETPTADDQKAGQ